MSLKEVFGQWYIRLALAAGILVLWMTIVDLSPRAVVNALSGLSPYTWLGAISLSALNLGVGAIRWQVLVRAFGQSAPAFLPTLHAYFVAGFFNTFLPANLSGDVLRAHASRSQFLRGNAAFILVLIERLFGFSGLFLLAGSIALSIEDIDLYLSAGVLALGLLFAVAGLAVTPTIALLCRHSTHRWAHALLSLPPVQSHRPLLAAVGLSVATQALYVGGAWLIVLELCPAVAPWAALAILPLALLSIYFPTFAGFGSREAAFALTLSEVGATEPQAIAASFAFGLAGLALAAIGGVAHSLRKMG